MTDRNKKIVEAVKGGMTYSEAAEAHGVTRNVVAGACRRAGLKVGNCPERQSRGFNKIRVAQIKRWNAMAPAERVAWCRAHLSSRRWVGKSDEEKRATAVYARSFR